MPERPRISGHAAGGARRVSALAFAIAAVPACQVFLSFDPATGGGDVGPDASDASDASDAGDGDAAAEASDGAAPVFTEPTTVATAPGVVAVALGGGRLYWSALDGDAGAAGGGAIFLASVDGAAPLANDLVVTANRVYYARPQFCTTVLLATTDMGGASASLSAVAGCSDTVARLTGNGTDFYALLHGAEFPKVIHLAPDHEGQVVVTDERADYRAAAVDDHGGATYADQATGAIYQTAGGDGGTKIADVLNVTDLGDDARSVRWITGMGSYVHYDKAAAKVVVSHDGLGALQRLALHAGAAYVTEVTRSSNSGRILRFAEDGSMTVVAMVTGDPFAIAVDDARVVWSNRALGTVEEVRVR